MISNLPSKSRQSRLGTWEQLGQTGRVPIKRRDPFPRFESFDIGTRNEPAVFSDRATVDARTAPLFPAPSVRICDFGNEKKDVWCFPVRPNRSDGCGKTKSCLGRRLDNFWTTFAKLFGRINVKYYGRFESVIINVCIFIYERDMSFLMRSSTFRKLFIKKFISPLGKRETWRKRKDWWGRIFSEFCKFFSRAAKDLEERRSHYEPSLGTNVADEHDHPFKFEENDFVPHFQRVSISGEDTSGVIEESIIPYWVRVISKMSESKKAMPFKRYSQVSNLRKDRIIEKLKKCFIDILDVMN